MAIEGESVENFRCGKQPECISAPSCDLAPVLGDGGSSIPRWSGGTRSRIAGAAQTMTGRSNQRHGESGVHKPYGLRVGALPFVC